MEVDNRTWHPVSFIAHEVATMLQEDIIHRINNQLAVVMGRAELLGCLVGDTRSRDNCNEIELAVQKITLLLNNAARQPYPEPA